MTLLGVTEWHCAQVRKKELKYDFWEANKIPLAEGLDLEHVHNE